MRIVLTGSASYRRLVSSADSDEEAAFDRVAVPRRARVSFRTQMLGLLVLMLVAVLSIVIGGDLYALRSASEDQAKQRALAIARTVAQDPRYATWVTTLKAAAWGPVQTEAEQVRRGTGALYVVITDVNGIRYSHPDQEAVGDEVSTDPSVPLSGGEETSIQQGTLGLSARGKVPLRNEAGAIVGAVSVGIAISEIDAAQRRFAPVLSVVGGIALTAGLLALLAFWRRLRGATHGLEPEEMADLLREHAAVLGGALDGIIAVDAGGRLRICNAAARRYLDGEVTLGLPAAESGLPAPLVSMLPAPTKGRGHGRGRTEPVPTIARMVISGDRVLHVRRLPVKRDGRDLGSVIVIRDRTDLDDLGRELEATRALTDALRAQTHEHANRLHALSGMLQLGHADEAREYLATLTGDLAWSGNVEDPYLAGLLAAKSAAASEQGVVLRVSEDTWLRGRLLRPLDTVTVIGNLIDNAIRAAASGARQPGWVEVSLLSDGDDVVVYVLDSGDGIPAGAEETIFTQGWTTKIDASDAHGVGLALARVTARRHGGDVTLAAARGEDHGAAFAARLVGIVPNGQVAS